MSTCECGCGENIKPNRRFINGHNARGHTNPMKRPEIVAKLQGSGNGNFGKRGPETSAYGRRGSLNPMFGKSSAMKGRIGEASSNWKGDDVGYGGAHRRLDKDFGSEKTRCVHCGSIDDLAWAYKFKNGEYSLNRDDYLVLCRRCHVIFDKSKGYSHKGRKHPPNCAHCAAVRKNVIQ